MMLFKNLSVRTKLIFSNMLMIIIPVLVVAAITSILMPAWVYFLNGMNPNARLTDSLGFISVYQLQRNVSNLEKMISIEATVDSLEVPTTLKNVQNERPSVTDEDKPNGLITPQILNICEGIEKNGSMLAVMLNDKEIYISESTSLEDIAQVFAKVNESNDIYRDSMINSSHSGTVLISVSEIGIGDVLRIIVANPTMTGVVGGQIEGVSENLINYGNKFLTAIFIIAIIAVLITNGLLAIISSNAILKPLKKLREATHEIRDGNLDSKVDYESKNELGQVCLDFEEMRQRLKRSVQAQQRYEENRVEMIACISHDLGTPLTSIKGYASGLLDGIADTPEKQKHYLHTIYNTANAMDKLVSELSMSSKLELNKIPFYFESLYISDFFEDCKEELLTTLTRHGMHFEYINNCKVKSRVSVDTTQFRRAVLNIIDNCIKYKRKDIDIDKAFVKMELKSLEDNIIIAISDNGLGVTEDDLGKIFQSFYRGDKARTNAGEGSGLGLSITRQIIERHRGKIWAESNDYGGLTVIISLPVFDKKEENDG